MFSFFLVFIEILLRSILFDLIPGIGDDELESFKNWKYQWPWIGMNFEVYLKQVTALYGKS